MFHRFRIFFKMLECWSFQCLQSSYKDSSFCREADHAVIMSGSATLQPQILVGVGWITWFLINKNSGAIKGSKLYHSLLWPLSQHTLNKCIHSVWEVSLAHGDILWFYDGGLSNCVCSVCSVDAHCRHGVVLHFNNHGWTSKTKTASCTFVKPWISTFPSRSPWQSPQSALSCQSCSPSWFVFLFAYWDRVEWIPEKSTLQCLPQLQSCQWDWWRNVVRRGV